MKKFFTLVAILSVCLVSCKKTVVDHEEAPVDGNGKLQLSIGSISDYITVETKSGEDESIVFSDLETYDVVIDGPTKITTKFGEIVGQVIELGSGDYSITVTSPATEPVAFEQPIYQAYEQFSIKAGEVKALNLTCTPYNCKVTIELTENFKKELATYEVVIGNGLGELIWTKDDTKDDFGADKAGYFLPRGLEINVKGHRSIDNTEATAQYYIEDPQPAEHHIITLDAKVTGQIGGGADGTPGISITVVTTFNEKETDVEIGDLDESYVDRPDFGDGDDEEEVVLKNEIIWEENSRFEDYHITPDSEIAMTIKMPAGIASFIVEVDNVDFQGALKVMTGDMDGDGAKESYIDLINDKTFYANMREGSSPLDPDHNLPLGDEIYLQTEVEFNLTCFVSMLCAAVAPETSVPFILKAYDVNGTPLYFMDDFPRITLVTPAE